MFRKMRRSKRILQYIITGCLIAFMFGIFSYIITAKNTYIISDGDKTVVIKSYSNRVDDVLKQAGISLCFHDSYTETDTSDGLKKISIKRAFNFSKSSNGTREYFITQNATVKDVIEHLKIEPDFKENIVYPQDSKLNEDMSISLKQSAEKDYNALHQIPLNMGIADLYKSATLRSFYSDKINVMPIAAHALSVKETVIQPSAAPSPHYTAEQTDIPIKTDETAFSISENGYITSPTGEAIYYSEILHCSATAYTTENQTHKTTATGSVARVGAIAVDPKVIPYGSRMYIVSAGGDWVYGFAVAEDCGGGIKGNKIDLFFDTYDECIQFGVRNAIVYILED